MNVTPLDIRRKEFDKGFRGYDPTEVDLFLKQVADRLEALQEETRRAEERARDAEAKLVHYEKVELALQEALESARETARSIAASSGEKARMIVQQAELRAETILRDAERERHGLRQDIVRLSSRQNEAAARLRGFLLSELEVLAQFQGDDPVGFIKLQAAPSAGAFAPPPARLEAPIADASTDWSPDASAPVYRTDSAEAPDASVWESPSVDPDPPAAEPAPLAAPLAPDGVADETPAETPTETPTEAPAVYASAPAVPSSVTEPPLAKPSADEAAPDPSSEWTLAEPASAEPSEPVDAEPESAEPDVAEPDVAEPDVAEPDPAEPDLAEAPTPPAVTGGWDLRSLVTGEERSVAASDEERERIRRILDDLD